MLGVVYGWVFHAEVYGVGIICMVWVSHAEVGMVWVSRAEVGSVGITC